MVMSVSPVGQTAARSTTAPQSRSVQGGVYTETQAKRGMDVYDQECVTCHGPNLTGGESGPALVGSDFIANWSDKSVGDLFERTRIDMPKDSPGRLSRQQYADVIAYILSANKYPAGDGELEHDTATLQKIRWIAR
jgi:mono/diheme cytochrome c family protein